MSHEELLRLAIDLAKQNIASGGGPFGAVIAHDGEVVATGCNRVTAGNDPTAHAEVSAIRAACAKLQTFNLAGYDIYSSCEPCPMCLSAIYWAHLDRLFYAGTKADAADAGFDDDFIYHELALKPAERKLSSSQLLQDEAAEVFKLWDETSEKTKY